MNIVTKKRTLINLIFRFNLTSVYCGSFNLSTLRLSQTSKNPLKKKTINSLSKKYLNEINRICVTILGNGAIGQPRCIGLFTDHKVMLFNCGEGVGRLLREYEGYFHQIKHAFITQNDWKNISGLPDIHLTHEAYGIYKLSLFGPPGIELFTSLLSSDISMTKIEKRSTPYTDGTFEIESICIAADLPYRSNRKIKKENEDIVFNYSCKILEKPADLIPEKLVEHNVPIGPHLLKLKNGENVVLPCGRKIYSSDVINSCNKEEIFLVVDCPSEKFLRPFVSNEEFYQYQLPLDSAAKVSTVFHFSPPHIMNTKVYKEWMNRFHSATQHIILNESCSSASSEAVHQTQSIFHLLHPDIFKLLPTQKAETQDIDSTSSMIQAPPMLQINFRPEKTINWNSVVSYMPDKYIQETTYFPNFNEEIKVLKSLIKTKVPKKETHFPEVLFLGTSSSTSSAYRNVSAILLNVSSSRSILLDCGENAFMQFVRYFGREEVDSELQKVSCVFVSHQHTDHYMGLFQFIKARIEAFQKNSCPYKPLALILPYKISDIFKHFCDIYGLLLSKVRIFSCKSLTEEKMKSEKLKTFLGDIEIETVPVKHCLDAYGIVLKKAFDWKIVYSGDTAPCQKLIDAGENCSLLIHEASIEDGCLNEAMMRTHSTPSQVIDISEKMNAQYTIMTHFSKRYLAVPVFDDANNRSVGCAFDFMRVQLHQLPLVPLFLPIMKCLFEEQLQSHSERTSFYVNFENSFLKSYRTVKLNNSESA